MLTSETRMTLHNVRGAVHSLTQLFIAFAATFGGLNSFFRNTCSISQNFLNLKY